ncbi:MAG: polyprenol monophosphomannose synthase [Anaerolineales bacterium]|nr:MAG: polyprenol monophosphomannose synthase [Anaerolineales bacterium]
MKITIIIPTYNEAENLLLLVEAIQAQKVPGLHILIVDDMSPDGTGEIADGLARRYKNMEVLHRQGPRGLGRAYIYGFDHVLRGDSQIIGQMDCDFSHPPDKLPELVAKLAESDLALGSRYIPGGSVDQKWPLWRKALSRWGNFYARTILGLPVKDVTGAFRLWRRELLEKVPYQQVVSSGYVFLYEILYLAHRAGARFGEVPFYFADRKFGQSKMRFGVQIEAALRVWQVRWRYRNWRPGVKISATR